MNEYRLKDFINCADYDPSPLGDYLICACIEDDLYYGKYGFMPWKLFEAVDSPVIHRDGHLPSKRFRSREESKKAIAKALEQFNPDENCPFHQSLSGNHRRTMPLNEQGSPMLFADLDWSHALSGILVAIGSVGATYFVMKSKLLELEKQKQDLAKSQLVIDGAKDARQANLDDAQKKRDDTATAAWRQLYEDCEKYRAALTGKVEKLADKVMDLITQSAAKDAKIVILESRVAQLEKLSPLSSPVPAVPALS